MLVSGGQGIMRSEVTYGVSRFARAGRFCCVRCCLFQAASVQLFRFFSSFRRPRRYDRPANQEQLSRGSLFFQCSFSARLQYEHERDVFIRVFAVQRVCCCFLATGERSGFGKSTSDGLNCCSFA